MCHNVIMPRQIPDTDFEKIFQIVSRSGGGVSIDDISCELKTAFTRRTLQRRLASLVEQGRLMSMGRGRGVRYRLSSDNATKNYSSAKRKMTKARALSLLEKLKPELVKRFGITRLALFGSTVHDEARIDSDIDILVDFDGPATSNMFFGVQFLLEDEFNRRVDLVTEKAIRNELRPYIEKEAINV